MRAGRPPPLPTTAVRRALLPFRFLPVSHAWPGRCRSASGVIRGSGHHGSACDRNYFDRVNDQSAGRSAPNPWCENRPRGFAEAGDPRAPAVPLGTRRVRRAQRSDRRSHRPVRRRTRRRCRASRGGSGHGRGRGGHRPHPAGRQGLRRTELRHRRQAGAATRDPRPPGGLRHGGGGPRAAAPVDRCRSRPGLRRGRGGVRGRPAEGRPGDVLPSVAGALVAAGVLYLLAGRLRVPAAVPSPAAGETDGGAQRALDRRGFVVAATAAAAASAGAGLLGRQLQASQLAGVSASRGDITLPAPASAAPPIPAAADLGIRGLSTFTTANKDFYRVDTALVVPRVDAAAWRLRIHGKGVARPVALSFQDLLGRELVGAGHHADLRVQPGGWPVRGHGPVDRRTPGRSAARGRGEAPVEGRARGPDRGALRGRDDDRDSGRGRSWTAVTHCSRSA